MGLIKWIPRPIKEQLQGMREDLYTYRFHSRLRELRKKFGNRVQPVFAIDTPHAKILHEELSKLSPETRLLSYPLVSSQFDPYIKEYWNQHKALYAYLGNHGREKALEHALTYALMDFSKVKRFCDIASAKSPMQKTIKKDWPLVEYWVQDMLYQTNLEEKIVGGCAQNLVGIENGFFDALTLHCSFEHFIENSDSEFIHEVDRVLSPQGACLIAPLYLSGLASIYFDPTVANLSLIARFDSEANLRPTFDFRQEHGRHYSPETLTKRVLCQLGSNLKATVIRFTEQQEIDGYIYLNFALLLHRPHSIIRL